MQLQIDKLGKVAVTIEKDYWDINKDYDKLTIVQVGDNQFATYISRIPVPAGTEITDRKYWIPFSSLKEDIVIEYNTWFNTYGKLIEDLQHQIESHEEYGIAVSDNFGEGANISISQRTLTHAINGLIDNINAITGVNQGIILNVNPLYFVSDDGCQVTISYDVEDYQSIEFFVDGVSVGSYTPESPMEEPLVVTITDTAVIKCEARINGMLYTKEKTVTKVSSFFIGAGSVPADIMDEEHQHDISGGMTGYYDIEVADGDYIMIVMDSSYESEFNRADMNGFEIPFAIDRETILGNTVYKSVNAYQAGTYRIYINR